jgi:ribonuclease P protein component
VKRRHRLRKSTDFERVRHTGKSYAHPFIVLISTPTEQETTRVGVSAGRSVGNAVQRNRAKRILRAAIAPLLAQLPPGHDLVILARKGMKQAKTPQVQDALVTLLKRARLLAREYEHRAN